MIISLFILLGIYLSIYFIKVSLMISYQKRMRYVNTTRTANPNDFSVVQPIVSGDPNLKTDLTANVNNASGLSFIWIVDHDDNEAIEIVNQIKVTTNKDISIIVCDEIPKDLNAKVYKQKLALSQCKKYMIALDDDSVLNFDFLDNIKNMLESEECIITGIPYYSNYSGFFSSLVTSFVNSNSLLVYLPMARINLNNTVNGMCYFVKTELMKKYNVFESIQDKLCDEYEIAKIMKANHIKVIQHVIPCKVGTTIKGLTHYLNLMKRWMVFSNKYIKENFHPTLFFLTILPAFLPLVLLGVSILSGIKYCMLFILIHFLKCLTDLRLRKIYLKTNENVLALFYVMLSDYLQPLHYINSLISSEHVQWRLNKVVLNKEKVYYEKSVK